MDPARRAGQRARSCDGVRGKRKRQGPRRQLPDVDRPRRRPKRCAAPRSTCRVRRLPPPKPGEYYWVDLEGLRVVNVEGVDFGTVSHLFATGANDVLVARWRARAHDPVRAAATYVDQRGLRGRRGRRSTGIRISEPAIARIFRMRIDVVTPVPRIHRPVRRASAWSGGRSERGLLSLHGWNPRDYAEGNYRRVDDRPFGGGPGMVMLIDPLRAALDAAPRGRPGAGQGHLPEPAGRAADPGQGSRTGRPRAALILLCGRYEGIDERLIEAEVDEELSIGDYVLSGGELAAAVVIDAVGPAAGGRASDAESAAQDSFEDGLLDCPHYTRPVEHELGTACRRCCCPATTPRSPAGAGSRPWAGPGCAGRTCWTRPALSKADRKLLDAFRRASRDRRSGTEPATTPAKPPSQSLARKNAAIMRGFVPPLHPMPDAGPRALALQLIQQALSHEQALAPHAPAEFRSRTDPAQAAGLRPRRHRRRQRQGQGRQPRTRPGL